MGLYSPTRNPYLILLVNHKAFPDLISILALDKSTKGTTMHQNTITGIVKVSEKNTCYAVKH